jgi:hypothetical protein
MVACHAHGPYDGIPTSIERGWAESRVCGMIGLGFLPSVFCLRDVE